tara:strand:+ start:212 stop:721 length:510 start_codon:yes stop_codon:yes gene_type:complete
MKQKGFTLIELLVVVAIIGVLAAVGTVAYSGYTSIAKKKATKVNYQSLFNLMKTQIVQCDIDGHMKLMSDANSKEAKQISCDTGTGVLTPYFINHMNNSNFKNPYDTSSPAIVCCGNLYSVGQTYVGVGGNDPDDTGAAWWFNTKIDSDPMNDIDGALYRSGSVFDPEL